MREEGAGSQLLLCVSGYALSPCGGATRVGNLMADGLSRAVGVQVPCRVLQMGILTSVTDSHMLSFCEKLHRFWVAREQRPWGGGGQGNKERGTRGRPLEPLRILSGQGVLSSRAKGNYLNLF